MNANSSVLITYLVPSDSQDLVPNYLTGRSAAYTTRGSDSLPLFHFCTRYPEKAGLDREAFYFHCY